LPCNVVETIFLKDYNVNPQLKQIDSLPSTSIDNTSNTNLTNSTRQSLEHEINSTPNNVQANTPSVTTNESNSNTPKTHVRQKRNEGLKKLVEDINSRQKAVEKGLDNVKKMLRESNEIQRERNELFRNYLEKK